MKIWARLVTDNKLRRDMIYRSPLSMTEAHYEIWIREICDQLDIPTPVLLETHYVNFVRFHNTRFKQDDFIESLGYDRFVVEDCKE